jgi:hypothetical protein
MGSLKKNIAEHRLFVSILVLMAGHLITFILALPYRFFPCDDTLYYQLFLAGNNELPSLTTSPETIIYIHPVYFTYLYLCRQLWSCFSDLSPSFLIFANLLANTASLAMIILVCRKVTGSVAWAAAAGLIFAISPWTANYYFMFSYVPFEVALIISAFTLQIYGVDRKGRNAKLMFMSSGILLAMAFWCSPSAAVSVALVMLTFPLLAMRNRPDRRHLLHTCAWVAVGFALIFLPYTFITGRAYLSHILQNVNTDHYMSALIKFGEIPPPPFFSFFRLLFEYSPLEAIVFVVLAPLVLYSFFCRQGRSDLNLRICILMGSICLIHNLIVDLLPTTKLGRTHFHAYPFLIIFIIATCYWIYSQTTKGRTSTILVAILSVLLLSNILYAIERTMLTRTTRFALPELLDQLELTNIYLIEEDPHADYIKQWLNVPCISIIDSQTVTSVANKDKVKNVHGMLIIGPTGPGSGNSILEKADMPDFNPMIPDKLADETTYLPYYAFNPSFLFEEEICLALYFRGESPSPLSASAKLKILSW